MNHLSIRARLALGAALQTVVALLVVAAVQFVALISFLDLSEHERLESLLPGLRVTVQGALSSPEAARPVLLEELPGGVDVRILRGQQILAQSGDFPPVPTTTPEGYQPLAGHSVLTAPLTLQGQQVTAQLASGVLGVINPLRAYLRALLVTVPLAAALVATLSFLLTGRLLRPLTELQLAVMRLGRERNLLAPLPGTDRQDEVGQLAGELQAAFVQVAEAQAREVEFTRAAAHDLRGPLAALSMRIQGALAAKDTPAAELRGELHEALADVNRMTRLTTHLLLLARGQSQADQEVLHLAQITGEVVDRFRERAPDLPLEFRTEGRTWIVGDRSLLVTLTENLLGNALRYAPGTEIELRVDGTQASGPVVLTVTDGGAGVPEAELSRLTEPFYRVDKARAGEGNGLGLAIVDRVAGMHGATLAFRNLPTGGFEARVTFKPYAPPPS